MRIISRTTAEDKVKDSAKAVRTDLALVQKRLNETTYVLALIDGSGTKTCKRDELEVF